MKTFALLFLLAVLPLAAQRQCRMAQYTMASAGASQTQVILTAIDGHVWGYEVQIKYQLPTPTGPISKRTMAWVNADSLGRATAIFSVAMEQITEVAVSCAASGQQ